jgi:ketosteroid isomerase-like protein
MTKSAFIDLMKSGAAIVRKAVRDEAIVHDYGELAVVTGVVHVDVTVKGEDKTIHSRYLHVWIRKGQGWKLVARQATYLPEKN